MSQEVETASKTTVLQALLKLVPTILVLALMAGGWMTMHYINSSGERDSEGVASPEEAQRADTLVLPEGKLRQGKFKSAPIGPHAIQHVHTIPGRLRYDATKHVAIKAPIDGILAELLVTPGDKVSTGDLLATVSSSLIGQARSEVLNQAQRLEIAHRALEREQAIAESLKRLFAMVDEGKSAQTIEADFRNNELGQYRQEIMSAYAKMRFADELVKKARPLAESGSIAGKTLRERENVRQLAETAFRTARDESQFGVSQAVLKAEADAAEAQRQVDLAWQFLEGLLGVKVDKTNTTWNKNALSRLEIRAPFSGSIETCAFAINERVARGEDLLILANTETLYVEASLRESDWSAVALASGTSVVVRVPALDDREFSAKVHYVGREVDTETNSIPLVATIDNSEGLFRPGMFIRVTVPIGETRTVLSVAPESVLQHENRDFVFVDLHKGQFKRVDVGTGQKSQEWVEVKSGLSEGQLVVTNGAFLLKSELLLQGDN